MLMETKDETIAFFQIRIFQTENMLGARTMFHLRQATPAYRQLMQVYH